MSDGLQTIPAALRRKERYILFKIEGDHDFGLGDVVDAMWKELISFLGEQQVSKIDPWIMGDLFSQDKQVGGIRVNKDYVEEARTAIALIDRIGDTNICIHVLGVSGTIESARDKYLQALD
ncbi:MAG: Rpp14/Pop5 family protein [Candidatus Nanohaloarchaea archaeon]|nr:Rpp14/Pop5 family protein [Candidatus Nanohaloarchaea archaeon]